MTAQPGTRRRRGNEAPRIAAQYLACHGFPDARAVAPGVRGPDITDVLGLSIEVKARADWDTRLNTWLAQAVKRAGNDLPLLISQPHGYGPDKIRIWPVTLQLADAVTLLLDAGYGDKGEIL